MASFRNAVAYFTPLWGGALNFIAVEDQSGAWDERTRRRTHGLVLVPIPGPESLNEIALFWNVRAALWPFGQWVGLLPVFDADLQPPRFRSQALQLLTSVLLEEERSILLVDIDHSMDEARQRLTALLRSEPPDTPEASLFGAAPIDLPVDVGFPQMPTFPVRLSNSSSHQLPSRLPNPVAFRLTPPHIKEGWCAVDVLAADPRLALPPRAAVGALVHPKGRLLRDAIAVTIQPTRDHAVTLTIPSDAQVVDAVLANRALTHERSAGGQ